MVPDQLSTFAADKLRRAAGDQELSGKPIDIFEAFARALKYNLDTKVEVMEAAMKNRELNLANYDMLPGLVTSSGFSRRNEGDSSSVSTSDTDVRTSELAFSWSILDFGLSYIRAKQAADQVLIQQEMKRKVVNRVIEDVRTAYWRAVSYDRLVGRMRALEKRVSKALLEARQLSAGNDTSPLVALTYERELIQIKREVEILEGELIVAKSQLSALMNIEPGTAFALAQPAQQSTKLQLPGDLHGLFQIAAINRPEMREVAYRMRINEKQVQAAMLELLPNFNVFAAVNYDSNKFIATNDWVSWGSRISWNLIKLTSAPVIKRQSDAQREVLDARALSVAMAVMTQVHVSRVRYSHLQKSYVTAVELSDVSHRLLDQVRSETEAQRTSEQNLIREEMNTLLADSKKDMAYADLQNAYANVYVSLGLDPFPSDFSTDDTVEEIGGQLKGLWSNRATAYSVQAPSEK